MLFKEKKYSTTAVSHRKTHPFHLVDPSPWPICMSVSVFVMALGLVLSFHGYVESKYILGLGISSVLYMMYVWWRDISRESLLDHHTVKVQSGLQLGMMMFIVTEAMFFFGLLWAFLHAALMPTVQISQTWPPEGIVPVDWTRRPALNSALLATSYFTANLSQYAIQVNQSIKQCRIYLGLTIILGVLFTFYQYLEYNDACFTMSDSVYGCNFFLATGFHGFHVIVGFLFLTVCFLQLNTTTREHSIALQLAVLYWHFVDIVWIAIYGLIYVWGNLQSVRPASLSIDSMSLLDILLDETKADLWKQGQAN
uniref:Cytochrome c oxidase subunit 3 n=1 Tax=Jenufa perforata TaxID=993091 RepID=A0A6G7IT88_9CHLO|nr:cytochrome c oxidase subunit 3 [Jenufa perforata]QII41619.1 cytochrome c oxidase subunit 3 [Jenufa perforata]